MNQITIFNLIDDLPEPGDRIETDEGKIRIIGLSETWGGQEIMLYDSGGILKGKDFKEFKEWVN